MAGRRNGAGRGGRIACRAIRGALAAVSAVTAEVILTVPKLALAVGIAALPIAHVFNTGVGVVAKRVGIALRVARACCGAKRRSLFNRAVAKDG